MIQQFIEEGGRWIYVISRDETSGGWTEPRRVSTGRNTFYPRWSPRGEGIVALTPVGIVSLDLEGNQRIVLIRTDISFPDYSADGNTIFFVRADSTGVQHIYSMPTSGGATRMVLRFDDPSKRLWPLVTYGDGVMYVSISDYESDIYAMDVEFQ